jgi:NAD(P)-dependent dehydrogenase (short-subunit alcohol dehydrogenase family)
MKDLKGKAAVVTGGAQGIGKGIATRLLEAGMKVVIADIDEEAGLETAGELASRGYIRFIPTDVSDEPSVSSCMKDTFQAFERIDALVNNAGISDPGNRAVDILGLQDWNRILAVNLTGCFLCVKHAIPHLRASHGAVVNIASTRALQSEADTEAYAASKGGLVALTHALAVSLSGQVRVNCISPGWIEVSEWQKSGLRKPPNLTPDDHRQHPAGRVGTPKDVADLAAYLVSKAAGFITGQNFVVDGGMTKKMIYV